MSVRPTDKLIYPSRATGEDAIAALDHALQGISPEAAEFLRWLYHYAHPKGIDFTVIASHAANECDLFRDQRFRERRDAFGMGVTEAGVPGLSFDSYEDAAFYAVMEYCQKLGIPITPEEEARARQINNAKFSRVAILVTRPDFPDVKRLDQMNSRFGASDCWWMCDPDGPRAIVEKSAILFPSVPDQVIASPGEPAVATRIPDFPIRLDIDSRVGSVPLLDRTPSIAIHNTGNSVSAAAEDTYFDNGAGGRGVNVHFIIDPREVVQRMKLWAQGVHAGTAYGNTSCLALELVQYMDPFSMTEENAVKLIAALHIRDDRLDFSGAEAFTFSADNVTTHGGMGGNPGCPGRSLQVHGGHDGVIRYFENRALQLVNDLKLKPNPIAKVMPHPVGNEATKDGKSFIDKAGNEWIWMNRIFQIKKPVQAYEWANVNGRRGPLYSGKSIRIYWMVAAHAPKLDDPGQSAPELWGTTRLGWRVLMRDVMGG